MQTKPLYPLRLIGELVEPPDPECWPPVDREIVLTLDDILLEDGKVAPFSWTETAYSAMGRFGEVLLMGGATDLSLTAQLDEVVRCYLTNTANTTMIDGYFKREAGPCC
jgi:hypothetical protein